MNNNVEKQYQHFISKFLIKNFKEKGSPVHKCENGVWSCHNPKNTGGEDLFYGSKDNSLELFFGEVENVVSRIIKKGDLCKRDKAYMKIFIQLMANRSPSKNQKISEEYENYVDTLEVEIPDNTERYSYLKNELKEKDIIINPHEIDFELKDIVDKFTLSFNDSDKTKFFPDLTIVILQLLPKLSKCFDIHIFESDYDLVIGETPTVSINLSRNETKTNGEEAGICNENVMYWLPVAFNKVAFMYTPTNIFVQNGRKLRKQDVNILNYWQTKKSPYFYARTQEIEITELSDNFSWVNHFNYVFGYKNIFFQR